MDARLPRADIDDRLAAAASELRCERRRIADELEALEAFADRVRSIPTERHTPQDRQPVGVATEAPSTATGLRQVREAYESTLMSVPHYVEEYDDTYVESLAEEFSPDIASALTDGAAFNGRCKRTLLSAVETSRSARDSLVDVVDRERQSVLDAKSELEELAAECADLDATEFGGMRFGTLDAYRSRLRVMEENCEALSARRQDAIFDQRRIQRLPAEVPDVTVYFYQDLDADYPVMSVVAELLDTIAAQRRRVEREMSRCRS
ncbi:uncharacterized protein Nmlp_2810 [Natronomonas moolapensis 8.8.11]|uniref:DUF7260 domain-containing protein n=1 Tax=Natronomonas moolapensis (strain DSM 18674 / CECT 7526 / JCM 14361 / 8.8.11) TaxID=268739 RepID=M1XRT4_NATM8|nr:hypothetical protein [Natronomonas moolapensis]CCQ36961.1 uncharacterized protein Nmlp_2810 [Natronomonas moolapensis 8.8.11]